MVNNNKDNERVEQCINLLEHFVNSAEAFSKLPEHYRIALLTAAGRLSRPDPEEKKKRQKEIKRANQRKKTENERKARASTGIRSARTDARYKAPAQLRTGGEKREESKRRLNSPRNCYVCKDEFVQSVRLFQPGRKLDATRLPGGLVISPS